MRTHIAAVALGAAMLAAAPTATAVAVPIPASRTATAAQHHGDLVSTTHLGHLSRQHIVDYLHDHGLDPAAASRSVDLYRIVYRTAGVTTRSTTASALVALPRTSGRTLRTVAWLHGTRVFRGYVASVQDNLDRVAAVQFATAGYAAVAPDYLGLGVGPGHHPYMLTKPTVSASLDALHGARTLVARSGKRLDRDVLVSGFSQGGQATMLIGRALQQGAGGYFRAGALAPIAGPHDIRGQEVPAALDGRLEGRTAAFYLSYAMISWNRTYPIYTSPAQVFRAPYDRLAEDLFDGTHTEEEIFAALPDSPAQLFTGPFLARLTKPTGTLRQAFAANDDACTGWRPQAPVRLYAGTADRDVVYANSESCQRSLATNGTYARLINLGDVDHFESGRLALPQVLAWFNRR